MQVKMFAEIYGVSAANVYSMKSQGLIPSHIFTKIDGKSIDIDEKWIIKRKEFREKIQNSNIQMYYYLSDTMKDISIARLLEKKTKHKAQIWQQWMSNYICRPTAESVLNFKISKMHWEFYRAISRIKRDIER